MGDNYKGTSMVPSKQTFAHLNPELIRKLCFQTQAMRDYPGKKPSQEIIGENFAQVHAIGQRQTKYLDFQIKTAPLTNRLATKHAQAYQPLPLGDNVVNRALAASFKSGWQSSKGGNPCPLDGTSVYDDVFAAVSAEKMRNARQKLQKPAKELTNTIAPPMPLLETISHEQQKYRRPPMNMRSQPAVPPVPCHYIGGAPNDVWPRTSMRRVHDLQAIRATRSASTPELGMTPLPPVDQEILMRPRTIFMEPAK